MFKIYKNIREYFTGYSKAFETKDELKNYINIWYNNKYNVNKYNVTEYNKIIIIIKYFK